MGITLIAERLGVAAAVSTYRDKKRGDYTAEEEHLSWVVAPHVAHAARVGALRGLHPVRPRGAEVIETIALPAFVLGPHATVVDANEGGRALLAARTCVRAVRRTICAATVAATTALHRAIANVLATARGEMLRAPARLSLPPARHEVVLVPLMLDGVTSALMMIHCEPPS